MIDNRCQSRKGCPIPNACTRPFGVMETKMARSIASDTPQQVVDGLLDDPTFPNREHLRRLVASYGTSWTDEPQIDVVVLTDDTLGTDAFAYPATVRIGQFLASHFRSHGVDEYVSCRFVPEADFDGTRVDD